MGLNAQTTVPTFTANQVLTADQQNQSARTGVPVFATTVERDAAFGGSGEKTLAEGQLCYLESTNVVQYYDGAAWATVGPTSSGALILLQAQTAFTSVASVSVDNIFTSTYTDYLINFRITSATAAGVIRLNFRSGATDTTTNYQYQLFSSISTTNAGERAADYVIGEGDGTSYYTIRINGPQVAAITTVSSDGLRVTSSNIQLYSGRVWQNSSTQFDGFKLSFATSTGYYTVYGLGKS